MAKIVEKFKGGLGITADVIGIVGFIFQIVQKDMNMTWMSVFLALIGVGSALTVWYYLGVQREKDQEALLAELTAIKKTIEKVFEVDEKKLNDYDKTENVHVILKTFKFAMERTVNGKIATMEEKQEATVTRMKEIKLDSGTPIYSSLSLMERMAQIEILLHKKGLFK